MFFLQSRRGTLKCVSVIRPVPAGLFVPLVSCPLEEGAGLWTSKRFRTGLLTRTLVNLRDYKLENNELELYKIQNKSQIQDAAYAPREVWLSSKKMTFSWGQTTKSTSRLFFWKDHKSYPYSRIPRHGLTMPLNNLGYLSGINTASFSKFFASILTKSKRRCHDIWKKDLRPINISS